MVLLFFSFSDILKLKLFMSILDRGCEDRLIFVPYNDH